MGMVAAALVDGIRGITNAYGQARPEAWLLIAPAILVVLIAAIRSLGLVRRRLVLEVGALDDCEQMLSQAERTRQGISRADVSQWLSRAPEGGIVRTIVYAVWDSRNLASPDLEAMATVTAQNEVARLSFARTAPNILLLTGLAGTVIGMAAAVHEMAVGVGSGDVNGLLAHIRTAFACTLWGITAAVPVALATSRLSRRQNETLARALALGVNRLAPRIFPRGQELAIEDFRTAIDAMRGFLESLPGAMKTATEDFHRVLLEAGGAMSSGISELREVSGSMQASLSAVAGQVLEGTERLRESVSAIQDSASQLREHHDELAKAYEGLHVLFTQSQRELDRRAQAQLDAMGALQEAFGTSASRILSGTEKVATGMQDAAGEFREVGAAFRAAGELASQEMKQSAQNVIGSIGEVGASLRAAGEQVSQGIRLSGEDVTSRIDYVFQSQTDTIRGVVGDFQRVMGETEGALRFTQERLHELIGRFDPALLPKEEWQKVTTSLTTAASAIDAVRRRLESVPTGPPSTGGSTEGLLEAIRSLEAAVRSLERRTEGPRPGPPQAPDLGAVESQLARVVTLLERMCQPFWRRLSRDGRRG